MPKYVEPVSKLHWTFAVQAGRAEWKSVVNNFRWFKVHNDNNNELLEVLWRFSGHDDGQQRMFDIRIRVED